MKEILENNVAILRAERGVTQEEMGRMLDITRQTVIAIEKGNYTPSALLALKIARYFKRPVEEIFKIKNAK